MKKLLLSFVLIFLLSSCKATNKILYSLYVASIGITYDNNENEYSVYFLFLLVLRLVLLKEQMKSQVLQL